MKKLLHLLSFCTLLTGASAQNSTCGSISSEILPTEVPLKLCEGEPTTELTMNLSSNLPQNEFFVINVDALAEDGLGNMIVGISQNGVFVPENMGLTYDQRFAVRPFAFDINEFRSLINVIINNSSSTGQSCCAAIETIAKNFCTNLSAFGIDSGEDVNNLNDVWNVLQVSGGNAGISYSVEGFTQQINLLGLMVGGLPENCQYNSEYCYALGNNEQLFEVLETPQIVEVNTDVPNEITISSTISDGVLEYSINPNEGWQANNTIFNTPTQGMAYVREANSECEEKRDFQNSTLSVELIYFKGIAEATTNLVYWATATEINSLGFGIERSSDGVNFTEIGWVDGAGNSQSTTEYQFRDRAPLTGAAYYRLAMQDISGGIDYSNLANVQRNDVSGFSILSIGPNPSANMINVSITNDGSDQVTYFIYDVMGRKVRYGTENLEVGINNFRIDASVMGTGMYVFTAFKGDYIVSAYKFVMH